MADDKSDGSYVYRRSEEYRWPASAGVASPIVRPSVEQVVDFMKFLADNNLWDRALARFAAEGVAEIVMGWHEVDVLRRFIEEVLTGADPAEELEGVASVAGRCGCPSQPPAVPHHPPPHWKDPGPWH
jgi:hypothetical protein